MKYLLCCSLLAFSLFADEIDQGYPLKEQDAKANYSIPARIQTKDAFDVFLKASFIYWQAKQDSMAPAQTLPAGWGAAGQNNAKTINLNFDYKPGFSVCAGFNLARDNWCLVLDYTRLHLKDKVSSYATSPEVLKPYWTTNEALQAMRSLHASWRLNFDMMDLKMDRAFYCGHSLILDPSFGLRGGWIDQHYNIKYELISVYPGEKVPFNSKSSSWLLGPRGELLMKWVLGYGISIIGDAAFGLLYQNYSTSHSEYSSNHPTLQNYLSDRNSFLCVNSELDTGLNWGTYLNNKKLHLDLSLRYDFQAFSNQNLMKALIDQWKEMGSHGNNLYLHGLTFSIGLCF